MIKFKLGGDFKGFNLKWWTPTKREWAPVLANDQRPFWQQQTDPTTGRPWARLTPQYASWKERHFPGRPILQATGEMQNSMEITVRGNVFSVKSTNYGKYQQFGTSVMVARPWVGVPDESMKQIVPISWKHILSRKTFPR